LLVDGLATPARDDARQGLAAHSDQCLLRINEYVREVLHVPPEKVINNIERYGNTTAATLPSLLFEAEESGRLRRGMKVVLAAFGAGFTWGCSVIDW
jgi:3-oxoacyl-[acyl-carrier-protein] synthase-3